MVSPRYKREAGECSVQLCFGKQDGHTQGELPGSPCDWVFSLLTVSQVLGCFLICFLVFILSFFVISVLFVQGLATVHNSASGGK